MESIDLLFSRRKMYCSHVLFLGFGLLRYIVNVSGWINNYDQQVDFQCPDNSTISYWRSVHHDHYEDRLFDLQCGFLEQTTALTPICTWTDYVNSWDQTIDFHCPNGGYINGYHSVHHNHYEDRIMKFRCCNLQDMCAVSCRSTGWVNSYDQEVYHSIQIAEILHGVQSQHHNHYEDRVWGFTTCYFQRC